MQLLYSSNHLAIAQIFQKTLFGLWISEVQDYECIQFGQSEFRNRGLRYESSTSTFSFQACQQPVQWTNLKLWLTSFIIVNPPSSTRKDILHAAVEKLLYSANHLASAQIPTRTQLGLWTFHWSWIANFNYILTVNSLLGHSDDVSQCVWLCFWGRGLRVHSTCRESVSKPKFEIRE